MLTAIGVPFLHQGLLNEFAKKPGDVASNDASPEFNDLPEQPEQIFELQPTYFSGIRDAFFASQKDPHVNSKRLLLNLTALLKKTRALENDGILA